MIEPLTTARWLERMDLAVRLRRAGCYHLAWEIASDIKHRRPQEPSAWHSLGQIATELGEFGSALECSREAYSLIQSSGAPSVEQIQTISMGLGQALMRFGSFTEARPLWEAGRLNVSWQPWPGSRYWCGDPEDIDSLLIQSEGGYGDAFMFARWIPYLKHRFDIKRIGLMAWRPLRDVFDWKALGVDNFYAIDRDQGDRVMFSEWKYSTSIMSLISAFRTETWEQCEQRQNMSLMPTWAEPSRRQYRPFRVGFCWRAEENTSPVRTKSLPLEVAQEISDRCGKEWVLYSLSPAKADLYNTGEFTHPRGLVPDVEKMRTWKETSDYVRSMDFIVTVDTAIAHLAGVMGIPTLVLLPKSSCWRWGLPGQKCAWYGDSLTLYRQPKPLDWEPKEIFDAISERIGQYDARTIRRA